jgi:2-dehydro-3-deoxy-D-arabinonate dehydratase
MFLFLTEDGVVLRRGDEFRFVDREWDRLIAHEDLHGWLSGLAEGHSSAAVDAVRERLLPPIGSQEIWACGVTYHDSQMARREESAAAGGGDFYTRVYHAERPEIFFKSAAHRARGHGQAVRIRRDSTWDVPEPELVLVVSPGGKIHGYTVGNDMSSRSIEGENPLYLPQAKTYEQSAGIGPGLLISEAPLAPDTEVRMTISRAGSDVFSGATRISAINREFSDLVAWLRRELEFPAGCYLMTGTGIVPGRGFTLQPGDRIAIAIAGVGALEQTVVRG